MIKIKVIQKIGFSQIFDRRPRMSQVLWGKLLMAVMLLWAGLWLAGCGRVQGRPEDQRVPQAQQAQAKPEAEPEISLYLHETGEICKLSLETYLLGVVAAEMEPAWPQEALGAQAILARTFTLERMASTGGVPQQGTDASTDVEAFQAYDEARINEKVRQAVAATRGEVVTYEGNLIKAWFFADGGGLTAASAEEGLAYNKEPTPYVHSVEDPGSARGPAANQAWQVSIPLDQARNKLRDFTGTDPGEIRRAAIIEKGPSGRTVSVKIGNLTTSGSAMRLALGSTEVKSALLTQLKVAEGQLQISGKGYGHGVGMSQWGAKALAEQGKTGEEIVQYFFKDVEIEKLYP